MDTRSFEVIADLTGLGEGNQRGENPVAKHEFRCYGDDYAIEYYRYHRKPDFREDESRTGSFHDESYGRPHIG